MKSVLRARISWVRAVGLLAIGVMSAPVIAQEARQSLGNVTRLDPRLDEILPAGAKMEILSEGYDWAEGPVWMPGDGGFLLFSDVPRNVVYRWKEGEGVRIYLRPSGYTGAKPRGGEPGSNGLVRAPDGSLVLMQHGDRRVAKLTQKGWTYETMAAGYDGKSFNSPNDGAYSKAGDLYFTDPPYGLEGNVDDPTKELEFQGVYKLAADGKLSLLTKELSRPNGVALSADEKVLYVNNSDPKHAVCVAYPIQDDGSLGEGHVFFDLTEQAGKLPGLPDGLKVDVNGNVFATGPGGVLIFGPDGKHLGTLDTGVATANCGWGDDGSTLYITADSYLVRIKTKTRGAGF